MKKSRLAVLIVDDQEINRGILQAILKDEYEIFEAENGREAFSVLEDNRKAVGAVLLDLVMPVMDGYAFLREIEHKNYKDVPIIVLTGDASPDREEKALEMGAWDFISKPYQPAVLLGRLKNAIARSQMVAFDRVKHLAEHDTLTDLYNRQMFYRAVRELIDQNRETKFMMIRMDIDSFNLVNSFWGEKEGDKLLIFLADQLRLLLDGRPLCAYGRVSSDIFCACIPVAEVDVEALVTTVRKALQSYNAGFYIKPTFGIYEIVKPEYTIEAMYERATIAAQKCKGKYNQYVAYYDSGVHNRRVREREIENDMKKALDTEQFKVYLQPKYSLKTNQPYGAEALVRWIHPEKGMMSPGEFIPVFERNGFISELDYYMWDHVCALLRK